MPQPYLTERAAETRASDTQHKAWPKEVGGGDVMMSLPSAFMAGGGRGTSNQSDSRQAGAMLHSPCNSSAWKIPCWKIGHRARCRLCALHLLPLWGTLQAQVLIRPNQPGCGTRQDTCALQVLIQFPQRLFQWRGSALPGRVL